MEILIFESSVLIAIGELTDILLLRNLGFTRWWGKFKQSSLISYLEDAAKDMELTKKNHKSKLSAELFLSWSGLYMVQKRMVRIE
jgi:hypothetical protein